MRTALRRQERQWCPLGPSCKPFEIWYGVLLFQGNLGSWGKYMESKIFTTLLCPAAVPREHSGSQQSFYCLNRDTFYSMSSMKTKTETQSLTHSFRASAQSKNPLDCVKVAYRQSFYFYVNMTQWIALEQANITVI